jgi:cytochrome c556
MFRTLIAAAALAVATTAVFAQADLVAARKALMSENGKYMYRAFPAMLKGETPYDQAVVDAGFTQLNESAQKLPALFSESTKDVPPAGRFSISPKAWDNKADLDAKLASYAKTVAEEKPKVKDLETLKSSYAAVAKACDSCHDAYRVRN